MANENTASRSDRTATNKATGDNQQGNSVEWETISVEVRKDMDPGLRDSLLRTLRGGGRPPIVGSLADLQRMGADHIASKGTDDVFQTHPDISEADSKAGAKRTLEEEKAAKAGPEDLPAGPEEPLAEKATDVVIATREVEKAAKDAGVK